MATMATKTRISQALTGMLLLSSVHGLVMSGTGQAALAQDKQQQKPGGTIIGELKGRQDKDKNTIIEVLAPGEEKARRYFVNYDPKIKGPIKSVLAAVRNAKIGDRVEFEWIATGHGPAITSFKVLKKGSQAPVK
jgi:hypothetical protein